MRAQGSVASAGAGAWDHALARLAHRWRHWRLARIATAVLAVVILAGLAWREAPAVRDALASLGGTAALGTATCADWQGATQGRRLDVIAALGVAATSPDPESRGATLDSAAAYGLFQRVCATRTAGSTLLYEAYNRAASFQGATAATAVRPGGFGTAEHR
jgi:hypothetical protein